MFRALLSEMTGRLAGASDTLGVFSQAGEHMKDARRHHRRNAGYSSRPGRDSIAVGLRRRCPCVSMMKTADARERHQLRTASRLRLNRPPGVSLPSPS